MNSNPPKDFQGRRRGVRAHEWTTSNPKNRACCSTLRKKKSSLLVHTGSCSTCLVPKTRRRGSACGPPQPLAFWVAFHRERRNALELKNVEPSWRARGRWKRSACTRASHLIAPPLFNLVDHALGWKPLSLSDMGCVSRVAKWRYHLGLCIASIWLFFFYLIQRFIWRSFCGFIGWIQSFNYTS